MSEPTHPPAARRRRIPLRRLAVVLGVWAIAAGGALLVANALDSPVGEGERDEAQPAALGPVEVPEGGTAAAPGAPGANPDLPPLALVLDRSLPQEVAALPPDEQPERLRERAEAAPSARRLTELGSALQVAGDPEGARAAYERALRLAPGDVAARAGLAMVPGASGADGMARASAGLAALAREHPESQLVAFNQGWVEIYRRRTEPARQAWERTVALGRDTRLGRTAVALLEALETGAAGGRP